MKPNRIFLALMCAATFSPSLFAQSASSVSPAQTSFSLEADAVAYALKGYSVIGHVSFSNGFDVALGQGRYDVPRFFVSGDKNDAVAHWAATATSIQVFRAGYRFHGPHRNGATVHGIVLNQSWRLRAENLNAETKFRPIGIGISAGYYYHFGKHLYIYPNASLTGNTVWSGNATVKGLDYNVRAVQFNGSVHVGWEF